MAQFIGIVAATFVLGLVFHMMRTGTLRERHAVWWIIAGFFSLILALFPALLEIISSSLGITIPINFVFFVGIATLFFAYLQTSAELSKSEEKIRTLAEDLALLNLKVEQLDESPDRLTAEKQSPPPAQKNKKSR